MEHINFEKYEVNEDTRQITFSVCSDKPYVRYDEQHDIEYEQILIINENSVNLDRLKNFASILFNHDPNQLLGVVQDAYIIENKVFIKAKFSSNSEFAERIYKDMLQGICRNVSIGYQIEHWEDVKQNGINKRYVDKFMIFECSVVAIPADDSIGVRNLKPINNKGFNMDTEKEKKEDVVQTVENLPEQKIEEKSTEQKACDDVQKIEQKACGEDEQLKRLKEQNEELKCKIKALEDKELVQNEGEADKEEQTVDDETKIQIEKIGSDFGLPKEEIERAIESKMSIRDFKNKIKTINFNLTKKDNKMDSRKEFRDFLQKGVFDKPFNFRTFTGDGGFGGQNAQSGAALIGTDVLPLQAILQKKIGLKGYRVLSGLTHNISIPVQNQRITAYQTSELRDAVTTSAPGFESVTLQPHKIGAQVVIGKQLLTCVNDDLVNFVIDSALKQISYKIEDYMLGKVVSAGPTQINYSALSAFTYDDALSFQAAVDGYNLDFNAMSFVMSPSAKATLKGIPLVSSYPRFIIENDELNGFKVNVSGCVGNNNIYFGAWDQMILGIWDRGQGMSIVIDPFTQAANGNLVITASLCIDACLVQKSAFAIGKVQASSSESSESSSSL